METLAALKYYRMEEKKESKPKDRRKKYDAKFKSKHTIRLTSDEKDKIDKKRGEESIPEYLKLAALNSKKLGTKLSTQHSTLQKDILIELSRHGNNLNQMVKLFNSLKELNIAEINKMEKTFNSVLPLYKDFLKRVNNE